MRITNLNQSHAGKKIRCKIKGDEISDAKIQCQEGTFYICQNHQDGSECINMLGYRYSWCVDGGQERELGNNDVTDVELKDEVLSEYSIY